MLDGSCPAFAMFDILDFGLVQNCGFIVVIMLKLSCLQIYLLVCNDYQYNVLVSGEVAETDGCCLFMQLRLRVLPLPQLADQQGSLPRSH